MNSPEFAQPHGPLVQGQPLVPDAARKGRRLGRGLASLISVPPIAPTPAEPADAASMSAAGSPGWPAAIMMQIVPADIEPNPDQPRRRFDEAALESLAQSLRQDGMVQPVVVRRRPHHGPEGADAGRKFQLIAGERRWRAAQRAGLGTIPAIVRSLADDALLELALVENIQREELNALERAEAYRAIMTRHGLSQDELGQRLGESRATVGAHLRLLELPDAVRDLIYDGSLSFGHAKALTALRIATTQIEFAKAVVKDGWSVRELENVVAALVSGPAGQDSPQAIQEAMAARQAPGGKPTPPPPPKPANIVALEEQLTRRLGTRVAIKQGRRSEMGKVVIDFYCLDDFDRILEALGVVVTD